MDLSASGRSWRPSAKVGILSQAFCFSNLRASFSPGSTMPRRKPPAPLPPGPSSGRPSGDAADEAPSHAKSMPSVLAPQASHGGPTPVTEEALREPTAVITTGEGTVKVREEGRENDVDSVANYFYSKYNPKR